METEQTFDDATRAEIKDEISDLEDRLDDLRSRRADVEEQLQAARAAVDEATEDVAADPGESGAIGTAVERRAKRDTLEEALDRLDAQIGDAEATLSAARQHLANLERTDRLVQIVEDGAEAHAELQEILQDALSAVLDHLDAAADARERFDCAKKAFNQEAGGTSEGRVEAARTVKEEAGSKEHQRAVSLLLSSPTEASSAGLPRPSSSFPMKAGQTEHPGDVPALAKALRSGLHAVLRDREDE